MRAVIHILGLSLGIAICFLIFNVVTHSYSFDRFHPDLARIYRVNTVTDFGEGGAFPNSGTPGPLGEVIMDEVPGIEQKGRLSILYNALVVNPEANKFFGRSNEVTFADKGFFGIFPREWLAGDSETALDAPASVVITESRLHHYFPGSEAEEVLGKEMLYVDSDSIYAKITGVVKDYEEKTDLIFKEFISFSTILSEEKKDWYGLDQWGNVNSSNQLFIKVATGVDKETIDGGFTPLIAKNYEEQENSKTSFFAEPLTEMHFGENYASDSVSKVFLNGLIYIGLIILVLASLNFINLETAQAISRAKEVGIRKAIGGTRTQLIVQFLAETFLLVGFSTVLAMVLVEAIRMLFADYLPADFKIDFISPSNLLFYLGFPAVVSLVTGIYPSLLLSGYQPQRALKGELKSKTGFSFGVFLRKNLTVLQFSSSIGFIILVLVLNHQLKFVTSQPMGFDKEAVLYSSLPFMSDPEKMLQLQDRINQESTVQGASLSGSLVSSTSLWTSDSYVAQDTSEKQIYMQVMNVDSAFVRVNGIQLLAGKAALDKEDEIIINENYVKEAGFSSPEAAVGMSIRFSGEQRRVIGVVANFHSRTLREDIRPLIFTINRKFFTNVTVKLAPGQNLALAKEKLESIYKESYPHEEASFQYMDAQLERFYAEDVKIRNVLGFACGLAIVISCMGLFGLSSFTIAQRTKEISIRKVLGASLQQLLVLISKEYVILVSISFLLAIYPTYYFLNDWLRGFHTRVDMPYLIFVAAGLGVMGICLLIVGIHSYMASQTNPAKVLKDE